MTWDEWLDAKIAQGFERAASRALEKPVRAGLKIECIDWQEGRALIDDLHYFEVPLHTWNLKINGWQVAKKWLVDRKTTTLTQTDIDQYHELILSINELCKMLCASGMGRSIMEDMSTR